MGSDVDEGLLNKCLFCCDTVNRANCAYNNDGVELKRFLVNLQRFLNYTPSTEFTDSLTTEVRCCKTCLSLVEAFLEEYHLWKCAELLLHWRIQQLQRLLVNENAGINRPSEQILRSQITRICQTGSRNGIPRVRLSRIPGNNNNGDSVHRCSSESERMTIKKELSSLNSCEPDFKWILSLAAVALLGKELPGDNNTRVVKPAHYSEVDEPGEDGYSNLGSPVPSPMNDSHHENIEIPPPPTETQPTVDIVIGGPVHVAVISEHEVKVEPEETPVKYPKKSRASGRFRCPVCAKSIRYRAVLQRHIKDQHFAATTSDPVKRLWRCDPCKKSFPSYYLHRTHVKRHHQQQRAKVKTEITTSPPNDHQSPPPVKTEDGKKCERYSFRTSRKRTYAETADDDPPFNVKQEKDFPFVEHDSDLDKDDDLSSHDDEEDNLSEDGVEPVKRVKCSICQHSIQEPFLAMHLTTHHHVKDLDPSKVERCRMTGCTAFFRNLSQRCKHQREIHPDFQDDYLPENRIKWLTCSVAPCTSRFTTQEQLQNHEKLHGDFKCQSCSLEISYAPELALHEMTHVDKDTSEDSTFPCSRCPRKFNLQHHLLDHFCSAHLGLSTKASRCPICQAKLKASSKLKNARGFKYHLQDIHGIKSVDDPPPDNSAHCDLCSAFFRLPKQLNLHKIRDHWNSRCPECGYEPAARLDNSDRYRRVKNHMGRKHPHLVSHLSFACKVQGCGATFGDQKTFDTHLKLLHPVEGFQCSKCEKKFATAMKRSIHEKCVHGAHSFVCSECGKGFKVKCALQIHMEFHKPPEEWKYECKICQKRFVSNNKLTSHQRVHTKEKPFVCQFCGGAYAHRHNWRAHMMKHHPKEFGDMEAEGGKKKIEGNFMKRKGSKKGDYLMAGVRQGKK